VEFFRNIIFGLGLCLFLSHDIKAQSFTVSPTSVKAFSENYLMVKIEGWDCEQMQVRTDNGKIKKVGPCKYLLIPQRVGKANISVSKVQAGVVVDLGSKIINAEGRSLASNTNNTTKEGKVIGSQGLGQPLFQVSYNGQVEGVLRRRFDFKKNKLALLCSDNNALATAQIVSYTAQVIVEDEMIHEQDLTSDALDAATIKIIQLQTRPTLLRIASIKIKFKGKILLIKDLEFEIK
jgi:hypothetical protein